MDDERVWVVFRVWTTGDYIRDETIALFPLLPERTGQTWYSVSYSHIGQHGGADYDYVIAHSRPARPEEYEELAHELEQIGYTLDVRNRAPHWSLVYMARKKYMADLYAAENSTPEFPAGEFPPDGLAAVMY